MLLTVRSGVVGSNPKSLLKSGVGSDLESDSDFDMEESVKRSLFAHEDGRLRLLQELGDGIPLSEDRSLPHLIKSSYSSQSQRRKRKSKAKSQEHESSLQPVRCWKSLLLLDDDLTGSNEWEAVRARFSQISPRSTPDTKRKKTKGVALNRSMSIMPDDADTVSI